MIRILSDWLQEYGRARASNPALDLRTWASKVPELAEDPGLVDQLEALARSEAERAETAPPSIHTSLFQVRRSAEPEPEAAAGCAPGDVLGGHELVRLIGAGGMGQVWLARDTSLKRDVALKVIRPDRVSDRALEFFAREARASGRVDHPGVVRVLSNGEDRGISWIAMEYVHGSWTLREFLDETSRGEDVPEGYYRDVATFLARVADALEAAHTRGVIHRDLKPQNVLIAPDDEPKVTDFGLARITDESLLSQTGDFAGTYAYMSPEQVAARRIGLDHRTDVFSLGVVMYEMLALRRPFEGDTAAQVGHQIVQKDPPELRSLRSRIPRDLEVICGKCLEKDRDRRYATMADLAADLRRHLASEPILARPPGTLRKLELWARRNPTKTVAGAVAVAAVGVIGWFAVENGRLAEARAEQARIAEASLLHAEAAEVAERERAEQLERVTEFQGNQLSAIDPQAMGLSLRDGLRSRLEGLFDGQEGGAERVAAALSEYDQMVAGADFTGLALDSLREQVLEPTLQAIDQELMDVPLVRAQLLQSIAVTAKELGLLEFANTPQRTALELRREELGDGHRLTLESISSLGVLLEDRGEFDEADSYLREALAGRQQALGGEDVDTLASFASLGSLRRQQGLLDEAEEYLTGALEGYRRVAGNLDPSTLLSISHLGTLYLDQSRYEEAEPLLREAVEGNRQVLGVDCRETLDSIGNLGGLLFITGRRDEAEPLLRECLSGNRSLHGDQHPSTTTSINNLASFLGSQGKYEEAESLFIECLDAASSVRGRTHPEVLAILGNLGRVLEGQGKYDEAEPVVREAFEGQLKKLGDGHPGTLSDMNSLARLIFQQGRYDEAEGLMQEALEISRREHGPDHATTFNATSNLAAYYQSRGRLIEAEDLQREVLEAAHRKLGEDNPETHLFMNNLSATLLRQGRWAEAEALQREVLEAHRRLVGDEDPRTLVYLVNLGLSVSKQGEFGEAESLCREALNGSRRVHGSDHLTTLTIQEILAGMLAAQGKLSEAEALIREALALNGRTAGNDHPLTLTCLNGLGGVLRMAGKLEEAEALCRETLEACRRALGDDDPSTLTAVFNLSATLAAQQNRVEAETLYRELLSAHRRLFGDDYQETPKAVQGLADLLRDAGELAERKAFLVAFLRDTPLPEGHSTRLAVEQMLKEPQAAVPPGEDG